VRISNIQVICFTNSKYCAKRCENTTNHNWKWRNSSIFTRLP